MQPLQALGLSCLQLGDYAQALTHAQQLIQRFPQRAEGWKLAGTVQRHLNQLPDGLASLEKAILLAPDDVEAHCLHGDLLLRMEKYNEAFQSYANALRIEPGNLVAGKMVVNMFAFSHRPQEAWAVLQQLIALAPQVVDLRVDAVRIALRLGELRQARLQASEALVLAPDYALVRHVVGLVQMRTGDLPAAIASFCEELTLLAPGVLAHAAAASAPVPFDYRAYESLMWATAVQLAQAGVHAFPTAGTLLGLVRDGHLLPFDKDVDLGLPYEEMAAARTCLLANGWVELDPHAGLLNPRAFRHLASGLLMDLCGYHTERGAEISTGGLWMEGVPMAWNRVVDFPVVSLHLSDRPEGKVWALDAPETWLQALYGDWRTPDPDFDTIIACHNQRGFSLLTQCYALLRLADQLRNGSLHKARATTHVWLRHFPDDSLVQQIATRVDAALARA